MVRYFILFIINQFLCGTHFYLIKRKLLNCAGISCGKNTRVVGPLYVGRISQIEFGENVFIGTKFSVYGNGCLIIKNNVDIAPEVAFLTGSHEISNNCYHRAGNGQQLSIIVGEGCWIGARATITGNINIGNGTVIGACSFVNKSLSDNKVYVGIPVHEVHDLSTR